MFTLLSVVKTTAKQLKTQRKERPHFEAQTEEYTFVFLHVLSEGKNDYKAI